MSTPTPRTDAAYAEWQSSWTRTPFGPDFARTLERELAAEQAYISALEDQLDAYGLAMARKQAGMQDKP